MDKGHVWRAPFFSGFIKALESTQGVDYDASKRFIRPAEDLGIEIDCEQYEINNPAKVLQGDGDFFEDEFEEDFDEDFLIIRITNHGHFEKIVKLWFLIGFARNCIFRFLFL